MCKAILWGFDTIPWMNWCFVNYPFLLVPWDRKKFLLTKYHSYPPTFLSRGAHGYCPQSRGQMRWGHRECLECKLEGKDVPIGEANSCNSERLNHCFSKHQLCICSGARKTFQPTANNPDLSTDLHRAQLRFRFLYAPFPDTPNLGASPLLSPFMTPYFFPLKRLPQLVFIYFWNYLVNLHFSYKIHENKSVIASLSSIGQFLKHSRCSMNRWWGNGEYRGDEVN